MIKCKICECFFENKRAFSAHLQIAHAIKSIDYTIKYLNNGLPGLCEICQEETRYHSFEFKKYCKSHSHIAESEAGAIGGKAQAWNKGLTKETDNRIAQQAERQRGKGNHFYRKKHKVETIQKIKGEKRITEEEFLNRTRKNKNFFIDLAYEDYYSRQHQYFNATCRECGHVNKKNLENLENETRCAKCFPSNGGKSKPEQDLVHLLETMGVCELETNTRSVIPPKELDIFIPSLNFAIEYNGLYWHDADKIGKKAHLEKTEACLKEGVKLFHIFSDEWLSKQDIVKSMIKHRLNKTENRIYARKCKVKEISHKEGKEFFIKNHISGDNSARRYFALFYEDEIISCLSLKKPIQKKYGNCLEIARFATLLNTSVPGGFSKLFKKAVEYAKENGFEGILTYADRRFGEGETYEQSGFEKIGKTNPDYWYSNGLTREFRFKYRAADGLTEKQVAEQNKVFQVYGCGSNIFLKTL